MKTIIDSKPIQSGPAHDVKITFDDGSSLLILNADYGMREYPHPGYNVLIDKINNMAVVSDPRERGGWDYNPQHGRYFHFQEIPHV